MRYRDKNEYKIQFKDFEKNKNAEKLCKSLVYNLAINKTKAKYDDGNFLAYLASLIKCEYNGVNKKCKNIKYGDGGDAYEAIKIILKYTIEETDFTYIDIYNLVLKFDKYDEIYEKYTAKYKEFEKITNEYNAEIKKKYYDEYKAKYLRDKFDELNEQIKIYVEKLNKINDEVKNTSITNYNLDDNKIFEQYDTNKILIFRGDFNKNIKEIITFNNIKYKLCGSIIALNFEKQTHVISGIICNNIYYIYDSNNILLQCDWNKDSDIHIKKTLENKKTKYKFTQIYVLIYISDF
jgi:hypothetical protein